MTCELLDRCDGVDCYCVGRDYSVDYKQVYGEN